MYYVICMIILTVEPLAPACTISCRELLGNGLCKPTGIQALRESNDKRKDCQIEWKYMHKKRGYILLLCKIIQVHVVLTR